MEKRASRMTNLGPRVIVNVFALLILSTLLLGTVAFSQTLVTHTDETNFQVQKNDFSFGDFLKVDDSISEKKVRQFEIQYTAFPEKQALYRDIVEVKNTTELSQTIQISYQKGDITLYFEEADANLGPDVKTLAPGESAPITLLAKESKSNKNETRETNFSLRTE